MRTLKRRWLLFLLRMLCLLTCSKHNLHPNCKGPSQKQTFILLKIAKLDESLHEGDDPTVCSWLFHAKLKSVFCTELDDHRELETETNPMFEKPLTSALSSKPFLDFILEFAFGGDLLAHVALRLLQTLAFCPVLFSRLGLYLQHKLPLIRKDRRLYNYL